MQENIFEIEKIQAHNLPELQGLKEKQMQVVAENPFVEITDTKTYEEAKKRRTALVKARTDIEKQDKVLASKIKEFRQMVSTASQELIDITKPHEDKQQEEVKRYEQLKEAERQEKIRIEEERKNAIKKRISDIFNTENAKIDTLSFENINALKEDFKQHLFKVEASEFEEFALDFTDKVAILKQKFSEKEAFLIEKENQRLENLRLQAEREKLEKERQEAQAKQKAEAERIAQEQAKKEAELQAERQKIEAERKAFEQAQRLQREKEEAEQRAKAEAERKAKEEQERIARERAEAERLEALKPDKEKVIKFVNSLSINAEIPQVENKEIQNFIHLFIDEVTSFKNDFLEKLNNLK